MAVIGTNPWAARVRSTYVVPLASGVAPLARLELQESLAVLFDRMPELKFETPPRYRDSYHFHGLESLLVRQEAQAQKTA